MSSSHVQLVADAEWHAMRPRCPHCRVRLDYATDTNVCTTCARLLDAGEPPRTPAKLERLRQTAQQRRRSA